MNDSATLIRTARERAGMTQAVLAERAGTSAPTISAYEHGTRHPRADVLLRVLTAAGLEPVLVPSSMGNTRYVDLYCDAVADLIRADPTVLDRAHDELDRMRPQNRHYRRAGPNSVCQQSPALTAEPRGD